MKSEMIIEMRTYSRHQECKVRLGNTEQWLLSIAKVLHMATLSPLSLLLFSPLISGWSRRARQDLWFRQTEMPPGYKRSKQQNTNKIRYLNNNLMESRLRILRWLSLLLLSAGLVGWSHRIVEKAGWRPYLPNNHPNKVSLKNLPQQASFKKILQTFKRTMEIELRTLRWLSLLLLFEDFGLQSQNLAHFSWFRRP
jgi:hypothetical protein